jgi:hypothetical protein
MTDPFASQLRRRGSPPSEAKEAGSPPSEAKEANTPSGSLDMMSMLPASVLRRIAGFAADEFDLALTPTGELVETPLGRTPVAASCTDPPEMRGRDSEGARNIVVVLDVAFYLRQSMFDVHAVDLRRRLPYTFEADARTALVSVMSRAFCVERAGDATSERGGFVLICRKPEITGHRLIWVHVDRRALRMRAERSIFVDDDDSMPLGCRLASVPGCVLISNHTGGGVATTLVVSATTGEVLSSMTSERPAVHMPLPLGPRGMVLVLSESRETDLGGTCRRTRASLVPLTEASVSVSGFAQRIDVEVTRPVIDDVLVMRGEAAFWIVIQRHGDQDVVVLQALEDGRHLSAGRMEGRRARRAKARGPSASDGPRISAGLPEPEGRRAIDTGRKPSGLWPLDPEDCETRSIHEGPHADDLLIANSGRVLHFTAPGKGTRPALVLDTRIWGSLGTAYPVRLNQTRRDPGVGVVVEQIMRQQERRVGAAALGLVSHAGNPS